MVAYAYEDLGGISGVSNNPKVPYSKRGRDRDRFQNFSFECDGSNPFSGTVYLQGSLEAPPQGKNGRPEDSLVWFDVAQIDVVEEGGKFFLQTEVELSMVRVVCLTGDYQSSLSGTAGATVTLNGQFSINGIPITVNLSDDASTIANTINTNALIILDGTLFAEASGPNMDILRIFNNDGSVLTINDDVASPLVDMGFTTLSATGGAIKTIKALR